MALKSGSESGSFTAQRNCPDNSAMLKIFDAFWRALVYAMTPRVLVLTLMPLVLLVVLVMTLGYFYLDPAQEWVSDVLIDWPWLMTGLTWLSKWGFAALHTV